MSPAVAIADQYEAKKAREIDRQRNLSAAGRELAPLRDNPNGLPPIADPRRRRRCQLSLRAFCETYFPAVFYLEWSPDHIYVIEQLEKAFRDGNQLALAMPRGSGKTSLISVAAIWAIFTSRRSYVVIVAAAKDAADSLLESILTHCQHNETLAGDFPEVCFPLKKLGRNNQRRFLWYGKEITISATKSQIVFADIPGSPAAAAIIETAGITGNMRGKQHTTTSGEIRRPDFALVDDFQTDDSAKSEKQTDDRLKTLSGAVLGMAGPGVKIACLAAMTVIRAGDGADQLLDRKQNAQFRGVRIPLMDSIPTSELWEEYFRIREREFQQDGDGSEATAYYLEHQTEMDAGATPRWPQRKAPDELSATQHAMNLIQDRGRDVFDAEFQNTPTETDLADLELQPEEVRVRLSRIPRGIVPDDATRLTAMIDVHENLLYWLVLATDGNFSAWVVDYGTWPEQRLSHFSLRNVRTTITKKMPEIPTVEGRLYKALQTTFDKVLGRSWHRQDGTAVPIGRALVDAQWGPMTETVYQSVRESNFRGILLPSHGRFVGASSEPISRWRARKGGGETIGDEWRIGPNRNQLRITYDANHWKTQAAQRIRTAAGSPGSALLFGDDPERHRLLSEHFTSESAVEVASRHRRTHEWKLKNTSRDNHWWDCFVGSCVAASTLGARVISHKAPVKRRQTRQSDDLT